MQIHQNFKLEEPIMDLDSLSDQDLNATLTLSDFFTRFHAAFEIARNTQTQGDTNVEFEEGHVTPGRVVISPVDILSAFAYRTDMEQYQNLASFLETMKRSYPFPSDDYFQKMCLEFEGRKKTLSHEIWKRKQNRIRKGRMSKDEEVHAILSTFEVWAAKAIAQDLLLSKPNKGMPSCSSLLSIPCGNYFASILPKCKYPAKKMLKPSMSIQDHHSSAQKGCLGVTPNSLTHEEFLRLSMMVSRIEDLDAQQALMTSPMTKSVLNPLKGYDENNPSDIYSKKDQHHSHSHHEHPKVTMRGVDLVALWIRAQRNTSAFLYLMSLFTFKEVHNEHVSPGSLDSNDHASRNHPSSTYPRTNEYKFKAIYNGNSSRLQTHCNKIASIVEQVSNFAIANHLLFTRKYVHESISKNIQKSLEEKSRHIDNNNHDMGYSYIPKHLEAPIKQFLLRFLARRHRRALQAVFARDISHDEDYISYLESFHLNYNDIKHQTKVIIWLKSKSVDRTLSRLDRKISDPTWDFSSTISSFKASVDNILGALEEAVSSSVTFSQDVKAARHDFELLCEKYLPTAGKTIHYLIQDYSGEDAAKTLESLSEPWSAGINCTTCQRKVYGNDVIQCWNCGRQVHRGCIQDQHCEIPIERLELDRGLLSIYIHANDTPRSPDFVSNEIEWSAHNITLSRERGFNGQHSSWGLSIVYTETCEKKYNESIRNIIDPTLWDSEWVESSGTVPPFRVPYSGIVITSCGPKSMVQVGDVITEISLSGEQVLPTLLGRKVLAELCHNDIAKIITAPASSMTLKVFRPSENIILIANNFISRFQKLRDDVSDFHENLLLKRWYCSECKQNEREASFINVNREASLCQAVIRRLCMEESSIPFHDDQVSHSTPQLREDVGIHDAHINDAISISSSDSYDDNSFSVDNIPFISLRRLDAVMTILSRSKVTPADLKQLPLFSPFASKKSTLYFNYENLWSKPSRLLCTAMVSIFKKSKRDFMTKFKRLDLLNHFVKLYISWYKDVNFLKGPPKVALMASTPWLIDSCPTCLVYPIDDNCGKRCRHCWYRSQKENHNDIHGPICSDNIYLYDINTYDRNSEFIGTLVFVHESDPLIKKVIMKTGLVMEEKGYCKLLVISFVPSGFVTSENTKNLVVDDDDNNIIDFTRSTGIFCLLPIFGSYQSQYLHLYCEHRDSNKHLLSTPLLQLDGVIGMSSSQFMHRLNQTQSMVESIGPSLISYAKLGTKEVDKAGTFQCFGNSISSEVLLKSGTEQNQNAINFVLPPYSATIIQLKKCSEIMNLFQSSHEFSELLSRLHFVSFSRYVSTRGMQEAISSSNSSMWNDSNHLRHRENKRRKFFDSNISSDTVTSFDQDQPIFFEYPDAVKVGECKILYTDLLYWDRSKSVHNWEKVATMKMKLLNDEMKGQVLRHPSSMSTEKDTIVIEKIPLVQRYQDSNFNFDFTLKMNHVPGDNSYAGLGWGFELLLWPDKILRIGRIAKFSPAYSAGLRSNDKILSIDGIPIHTIHTRAALSNLLLGCEVSDSHPIPGSQIPYLHKELTGNEAKTILLLEIQHELPDVRNKDLSKLYVTNRLSGSDTSLNLNHRLLAHAKNQIHHQSSQHDQINSNNCRISDGPTVNLSDVPVESVPTDIVDVPLVKDTLPPNRNILNPRHLFRPSVYKCFFSLAESSVFLEALNRGCPRLAIRLLTPRYEAFRVDEEYKRYLRPFVRVHGNGPIPYLSEIQWQLILAWDLQRIRSESGPVLFTENGFEYRNAVHPLPIDSLFHSFFKKCADPSKSSNSGLEEYSEIDEEVRRIRGGGNDQDISNIHSLASLRVNSIYGHNDNYVFGWAKTNYEEFFVGKLLSQTSTQEGFCVNAQFTESDGILNEPRQVLCNKAFIYFVPGVDRDSELVDVLLVARTIISKVDNIFSDKSKTIIHDGSERDSLIGEDLETALPSSVYIDRDEVDDMESLEYEGDPTNHAKETNNQGLCDHGIFQSKHSEYEVKLMKLAILIEEDLGTSATSFLGVLPNGTMVHWFCSDPQFLYLRRRPISSGDKCIDAFLTASVFSDDTNKRRCSKCSCDIDQFLRSNKSFSYDSCEWIRIDGGRRICDLCSDLTTHLITVSGLEDYVIDYIPSCKVCECSSELSRKSVIFDFEKLVNLSEDGVPSLRHLTHITLNGRERELITLWIKIACLFRVECDGFYRLAKSLCPLADIVSIQDNRRLENEITCTIIKDDEFDQSIKFVEEDFFEPVALHCRGCSGDFMNGLDCEVCRCPDEGIISSDKDIHGVGCCLISEVCFNHKDDPQHRNIFDALIESPRTTLDVMKNLLLKISANIPSSLYRRTAESGSKSTAIWGENLYLWIRAVRNCVTARGLSQVLSLLKQSLEISKMPKWWKASNCGWVSTAAISVYTNASVSLQLYVLDAAIAEYSIDASSIENVCPESKSAQVVSSENNLNQNFSSLQKWAESVHIKVHEGSSLDDCMICADGGDLLCCEYCPNVAHQECVGLKHNLSKDEIWVCDKCRDRIAESRRNI